MADSNIVQFPQPDHNLSPQELATRIFNLSDEFAILLAEEEPAGFLGLLQRLERASAKLVELGDLVLRGIDRMRAATVAEDLQRSIAQARAKLEDLEVPSSP